jgi:signal peptidase I
MRERIRALRRHAVLELTLTIATAFVLALCVQAYAVKPYRIPSGSMEPTLDVGQRVLVNRFTHRIGSDPKVGDVVVFHPPLGADDQRCGGDRNSGSGTDAPCARPTPKPDSQNFIKRVVAVGGDRISVLEGHVIRNGKRTDEPFARPCEIPSACDFPRPIRIPRGYVFMMGDNRGQSDDSRFWGPVPVDWVIGKAFATYWPPSRLGGV